MLHEVRKLLFSEDVILRALLDECRAQNMPVPNAQVQGIKVEGYHAAAPAEAAVTGNRAGNGAGKGRVILEFVTANPDKPHAVVLNEHFVVGALILACRQHGIPLPRSAAKQLQMTQKGLALTVAMTSETPSKTKPIATKPGGSADSGNLHSG